jgi:hypothetical protein
MEKIAHIYNLEEFLDFYSSKLFIAQHDLIALFIEDEVVFTVTKVNSEFIDDLIKQAKKWSKRELDIKILYIDLSLKHLNISGSYSNFIKKEKEYNIFYDLNYTFQFFIFVDIDNIKKIFQNAQMTGNIFTIHDLQMRIKIPTPPDLIENDLDMFKKKLKENFKRKISKQLRDIGLINKSISQLKFDENFRNIKTEISRDRKHHYDGGIKLDGGKSTSIDSRRIYSNGGKSLCDGGSSSNYQINRYRERISLDGGHTSFKKRRSFSSIIQDSFENIRLNRQEKKNSRKMLKKQKKKENDLKEIRKIKEKYEFFNIKNKKEIYNKAILRNIEKQSDRVHFTVTGPASCKPDSTFLIFLWAHLKKQRSEVIKKAKQMIKKKEILDISIGPEYVARGTRLFVEIHIKDLIIKDSIKSILWDGEIADTNFLVNVPKEAIKELKNGYIKIYVEGCLLQKIDFIIEVSDYLEETKPISIKITQYQKAFCSYASKDRNLVVQRVQGMLKIAPDMDFFLDVVKLRSGENWKDKLWHIIPQQDIFYLFWSKNAKKSEWVEKEWRCALKTKGLDFIDPVPLSSKIITPPPELEAKHFYNGILRFMSE